MRRSAYRIVDANFNRAREAVRVVEDYCRFVLDSGALSGRAKELRHRLCAAVDKLDAVGLVASRDTAGDVGAGRKVQDQLARGSLEDCLKAGCKRLTEALRVLGETVQAEDPGVAERLERLRYDAYALEKDIVVFSEPARRFAGVRLYVIISSTLPTEIISLSARCASAGADGIQLRAKGLADDVLFAVAVEFVRICAEAGVVSIINDRADIAIASGADGVHLGQNDLGPAQVRALQARPMIIGRSTHSLEQLRAACAEAPTYAALGPVFATQTKPGVGPVGLEYVRRGMEVLRGTGIAGVAVGGIGAENIDEVLAAGPDCVAVCSAVTAAADPMAACRSLRDKIASRQR